MWNKARVFERQCRVHAYSKRVLNQRQSLLHLYIPWSSSKVDDLMFRLKAMVANQQTALIPFVDLDLRNGDISRNQIQALKEQLERGQETHLYMSNQQSIHLWKVKNVYLSKELQEVPKEKFVEEYTIHSTYAVWVEVEDVFVVRASHMLGVNEIQQELDHIINDFQTQQVFSPIQRLYIDDSHGLRREEVGRWVELGRSVTYDYFIRSCELEENVYQEAWNELSRATQHCLIMAEEIRHTGVLCRDVQKLNYLKESYENYLSAVMNELNEIYIRPFISVFQEYESMRIAWEEVQKSFVNPNIQKLINNLIGLEKDHVSSIQDFMIYIKNGKSLLFSLKARFSKKIAREEYLQLEHFLTRQENLVESFLVKKLDLQLSSLLEIKDWMKGVMEKADSIDQETLRGHTLKITHLLGLLSSYSYQDNLFFKIIEEKTGKSFHRRSFEDLIKDLLAKDSNKDSGNQAA